jgi:hypothetical protein
MADLTAFQQDNRIVLEVYEACARRKAAEPPRDYLGMSSIGKPCERALWLATQTPAMPVDGRLARVFDNGHSREEIIIADLIAAGFPVDGRQTEYSDFAGQFRGHQDGVIHNVTQQPHVLEIKTANDGSFKKFQKQGIKAKPEYEAQVHCYMGYGRYQRALFVVENKNTQELYTERVYFNQKIFDDMRAKAQKILTATTAPEKCADTSQCRFCSYSLSCDNPPEIKAATQSVIPAAAPRATEENHCMGCCHYLPVSQMQTGTNEMVGALRVIIRTLVTLPLAQQEKNRAVGYKMLDMAMNYRPDLSIPLTVLYGKAKTPADKCIEILEYVLDPANGWCAETYPDPHSNDPMTRHFVSTTVTANWCTHKNHKAIINYPIGCPDYQAEEVPF